MGECLIVRRGGESYELPVLSASYPKDVTVTAAAGASASFSISITTPGRPAEYTYQWYRNGAAVSGGTAASLTLTGLTAAATYSVYCKVTNKAGSVNSRAATLTVRSYLPAYTYTGSHQLIDDGNFNWRLKLLTSGTLTFSHLGSAGSRGAQAFLVGGGGAGAHHSGGGGGYTHTSRASLAAGTAYSVVVGAGGTADAGGVQGGTSSAFGLSAAGGWAPASYGKGGSGGSGGGNLNSIGGSDGGNGGGWDGDTRRQRRRPRPGNDHTRIRGGVGSAVRGRRRRRQGRFQSARRRPGRRWGRRPWRLGRGSYRSRSGHPKYRRRRRRQLRRPQRGRRMRHRCRTKFEVRSLLHELCTD